MCGELGACAVHRTCTSGVYMPSAWKFNRYLSKKNFWHCAVHRGRCALHVGFYRQNFVCTCLSIWSGFRSNTTSVGLVWPIAVYFFPRFRFLVEAQSRGQTSLCACFPAQFVNQSDQSEWVTWVHLLWRRAAIVCMVEDGPGWQSARSDVSVSNQIDLKVFHQHHFCFSSFFVSINLYSCVFISLICWP